MGRHHLRLGAERHRPHTSFPADFLAEKVLCAGSETTFGQAACRSLRLGVQIAIRELAVGLLAASAACSLHVGCASAANELFSPRPTPARSEAVDRWSGMLADASLRTGLPTSWLLKVMQAESGGNPLAVSPKGAVGLMQLMPATYAALRGPLGLGTDPFVPRDNILAGAEYLRLLYNRYGWPGGLAAYSAGPARVDAFLTSGRALPSETIAYLWKIASSRPDGALIDALARRPTASEAWGVERPATPKPTLFVAIPPATDAASVPEPPATASWRDSGLFIASELHNPGP